MILAIDPGTTESGWVEFDDNRLPVAFGKDENDVVLERVRTTKANVLAIEMVASYGMPVGAETFDTCVWVGRFYQRWRDVTYPPAERDPHVRLVFRREVRMHICDNGRKATDATVRRAVIDLYGPGDRQAIGLKASPGPLYGVKGDVWQALALAITVADREA